MVKTFAELNVHPKDAGCAGCPLFNIGASFARTDGTGANGVVLLGEALGESEALAGKPFQGEAGMMLNRILHRGAMKREDFLIANTINCHPANNYLDGAPYERGAVEHCRQYLDQTLQAAPQIKVLVPMGNTALEALTDHRGVKNFHGTIHWNDRYQRWVVPTLHPSFVLRTGCKEFPTVLFDIGVALGIVRNGGFQRSPVLYVETPDIQQLLHFVLAYEAALKHTPDTILAADIETNYSSDLDEEDVLDKDQGWPPTRISFAYRPNEAITVPFSAAFLPLIQRALGGSGMKVFWNGNKFDVPKLKIAGIRFNGVIIDAMDLWHFFRSDLPRGLGYVSPFFTDLGPWKHLNKERPEFYSCVDSDALLRIVLKIRAMLVAEGTWETFLKYFAYLEPRFARMSEIGIGIDEVVRQERKAHYENIRDNTAQLIQGLIPDELKPRTKGKQGGFKGKPQDVRLYLASNPGVDDATAWTALGYQLFKAPDDVYRWDKIEDFNHNSSQQIIRYIEHKYGSGSVPRDKKTGRPTTGQEELARLARQHDDAVLNLILDAANADGKITAFIRPWTPAADGRVHGIFTNNPATPRIASQGPNLQNFPIRSAEAAELRRMIVPGAGFEYLIECVAPETKILKSDLTWVNAESLKMGDALIAFDESTELRHEQRFCEAVVTNNLVLTKPRVKIVTTVGSIIVAENHLFLGRNNGYRKEWKIAKKLKPGFQLTFLTSPWETDESREGGYLAGIFDGEGWVHKTHVGWAQNPGLTHDLIKSLVEKRGFAFTQTLGSNSSASCYTTNFAESLHVLGAIRPQRLLAKAKQLWDGRRTWGKRTPIVTVLRVEPLGEGPVMALETTTGTYISEGFFSHNCDYKGIEAIIVGVLANDADYVRLAYRSIHSFVAAASLGERIDLGVSDSDLDLALKEAKRRSLAKPIGGTTLYDAAKRTVHGSNYREGALLLHRTFPEIFPTVKIAQELQDLYFGLFPKIVAWQDSVVKQCHEHCFVENPWHVKRWLWAAKKWHFNRRSGEWELVDGDDAKKAIATIPQGSAGMIMRGALMRPGWDAILDRACGMMTIHDSLVARARDARERDWVIAQLCETMEYEIPELGGIIIPVEIKVSGRNGNWGPVIRDKDGHVVSNPLGMEEMSRVAAR